MTETRPMTMNRFFFELSSSIAQAHASIWLLMMFDVNADKEHIRIGLMLLRVHAFRFSCRFRVPLLMLMSKEIMALKAYIFSPPKHA